MVFKMHRVTSDVSPTDKGRLTPCLNPHAKYIVHSSNGTTHDLLSKMRILVHWKQRLWGPNWDLSCICQ